MPDVQDFRETTLGRFARVTSLTEGQAKVLLNLFHSVFRLIAINYNFHCHDLEADAFLEIAMDQLTGEERPLIEEDLFRLFPDLEEDDFKP